MKAEENRPIGNTSERHLLDFCGEDPLYSILLMLHCGLPTEYQPKATLPYYCGALVLARTCVSLLPPVRQFGMTPPDKGL